MSAFSDLTPQQRKMARQAGAAFTPPVEEQADTRYGAQMMLAGTGPAAGDTYMNRHTNQIATVIGIRQGRYAWVKLRRDGRSTELTLPELQEHYQRCRPDGTLL